MPAEQLGEEYLIGLGGAVYSATTDPESADIGDDADEEIKRDDQGATKTVITKDRRKTLSLNVEILNTGGFTVPRKNTVVSVTPPGGSAENYRVNSAQITASKGAAARLAVTLIREDSMAAVYGA